jgi:recombinational DNA repair ATPase RecF
MNSAGAAGSDSAPKLRSRQMKLIADNPEQRGIWLDMKLSDRTVHSEAMCHSKIIDRRQALLSAIRWMGR